MDSIVGQIISKVIQCHQKNTEMYKFIPFGGRFSLNITAINNNFILVAIFFHVKLGGQNRSLVMPRRYRAHGSIQISLLAVST